MEIKKKDLIVQLYLPELLCNIGWGLTLPALPRIANEFSGDLSGASVVVALIAVGTLLFNIPAGLIATNLSRRTMTISTLIFFILASILAGISNNLIMLCIAGFLMGSCRASWMVSRMLIAKTTIKKDLRGRVLASIGGMNRIGSFAIGPALGGFISTKIGLQAPFFTLGLFLFASAIVILVWTPKIQPSPAKFHYTESKQLITIINQNWKILFRIGPAIVLLSLLRAARQLLTPLWGESIGLSVSEVGLAMSASGLVDMTMFPLTGLIMDRKGRRWAGVLSIFIMSTGTALLPLTNSFLSLLFIGILSGAGNGLGSGLVMTIGTDLAPQNGTGKFLGLWRFVQDLGTAAGPTAIGAVTIFFSLTLSGPIIAIFGIWGALMFIFTVKETLHKK